MAQEITTTSRCIAACEGNDQEAELKDVLQQYLELFNHNGNQVKFYMAPNAVLDWFGRTVRGAENIQMYMRNDVCTEYVHNDFKNAIECGAFESRPTHLQTRNISTRAVQHVNPKNLVPYTTSLKTRAESDVEASADSDNDDVQMLSVPATDVGNKTPERNANTIFEEITPPASAVKDDSIAPDITESEDEDAEQVKAKRLKRSLPEPFSYLRRLPTKRATDTTKTCKTNLLSTGIRTLLDDSSEDEEHEDGEKPTAADYTALHYLETVGVLRAKNTAVSSEDPLTTTAATTSRECRTSYWERSVRIRISYRRRLADQQLEFALIVYEHLEQAGKSHLKRRNLMSELNEVADDDDELDEIRSNHAIVNVRNERDMINADEQPALIDSNQGTIVATVAEPNSDEIAAALETAAFSIVPLRTPTKSWYTPPATPKRKPRHTMSGLKRLNLSPTSPTTPKRSAARSLRL